MMPPAFGTPLEDVLITMVRVDGPLKASAAVKQACSFGAAPGAPQVALIRLLEASELRIAADGTLSLGDTAEPAKPRRYYIQDTRQIVGNCALFWCPDGKGYTMQIEEAGLYSEREALAQERSRGTDRAWPEDLLRSAFVTHGRVERMSDLKERRAEIVASAQQASERGEP